MAAHIINANQAVFNSWIINSEQKILPYTFDPIITNCKGTDII